MTPPVACMVTLPGNKRVEARLGEPEEFLLGSFSEDARDRAEALGLDMPLTPDTAKLSNGDRITVPALANRPSRLVRVATAAERDGRIVVAATGRTG